MADLIERVRSALSGRYSVERPLGRGGMAVVYLALDRKHDRRVAIKVLLPDLAASLGPQRFLREINIEAQLSHPHILPLHDSGEADGLLYYVMPYVEGESLRDRLLREKQLPVDEALAIAREVAGALAYAHGRDVIHRDIKPENILLHSGHAVVSDFGIARAVSEAAGERMTETGLAIGTAAYMSPEQASGEHGIDGRTDVYALGCVLYEMLAGDCPFTGASIQAILARKLSGAVPALRIVRDTIPENLDHAVAKALATVPADRFKSAQEFADTLGTIHLEEQVTGQRTAQPPVAARGKGRRRLGTAALVSLAAIAVAAGVTWRAAFAPETPLDPTRIVGYPLIVGSDDPRVRTLGEDIATMIGYALDGAGALKWIDGWDFLDQQQRDDVRLLAAATARSLARASRAGFFLDGRVVPRGDSIDVLLALHQVQDDSVVRASAGGAAGEFWRVALRALAGLLPSLISGQDKTVEVPNLDARDPTAVLDFVEGERLYRRAHFEEALPYYRRAVRADSSFAIAALKGAQTGTWVEGYDEARELAAVATSHLGELPTRYREFAKGLHDYLVGRADSAVARLTLALEIDPEWRDAWMALGDVYTHLLPRDGPLDRLAESAFLETRRLDGDFTPPLYHLFEFALRKGDVGGARILLAEYLKTEPDSALAQGVSLMLECVERGPSAIDWERMGRSAPAVTFDAAKALLAGGTQADCSAAGWRAVLRHDSAPNRRWGALYALQSLMVGRGRYREASDLLDSATVWGIGRPDIWYVLDALAGAPFDSTAAEVIAQFGTSYAQLTASTLWLIASWATHTGNVKTVTAVAAELASRAAADADRLTVLLAQSVAAQTALARGDTVSALQRFRDLQPTASLVGLIWAPLESLARERLILAELLFSQGEFAEALRVASAFDSPTPIVYPMYLPLSLRLRLRAAEAMRDGALAERFRKRLAVLQGDEVVAGSG